MFHGKIHYFSIYFFIKKLQCLKILYQIFICSINRSWSKISALGVFCENKSENICSVEKFIKKFFSFRFSHWDLKILHGGGGSKWLSPN